MQKYLPELLEEINADPTMLQKMKGNGMNFQVWNPGSASRGVGSELEL